MGFVMEQVMSEKFWGYQTSRTNQLLQYAGALNTSVNIAIFLSFCRLVI